MNNKIVVTDRPAGIDVAVMQGEKELESVHYAGCHDFDDEAIGCELFELAVRYKAGLSFETEGARK